MKKTKLSWGLGIEHEMMFAIDDSTKASTAPASNRVINVIDSVRVVEVVNVRTIRESFDILDRAFGTKLPRLFERAAGATTGVVLSNALFDDPYIGVISKSEADVLATIVGSGLTQLQVRGVLITMAPYISNCLDSLFAVLVDATNDSKVLFEMMSSGGSIFAFNRIISMFYQLENYENGPFIVLSKLLSGSPDVYQFLYQVYWSLEQHMSPSLSSMSRVGAIVYGRVRVRNPGISIRLPSRTSSRTVKKQEQPMSKAVSKNRQKLLIAGVIRLLQIQVDVEQLNSWTNVDVEFVEVKTTEHRNATVTSILRELVKAEAAALAAAQSLDTRRVSMLPHSGYSRVLISDPRHRIDEREAYPDLPPVELPTSRYAGSYHFWFTLPHDPSDVGEGFARDHAGYANVLQWLEPLLMSCCGGDPSAIGAGTSAPRASFRSTLNRAGGIGTTDTCHVREASLLALPKGYPLVYYDSDEAFEAAMLSPTDASSVSMRVLNQPLQRTRIVMELRDGRTVPLLGCEEVSRYPRKATVVGRSADEPMLPSIASMLDINRVSSAPHNRILDLAYGAPYQVMEGSNVRILKDWCAAFRPRLQRYWQAYPVMVGETLTLRFFNKMTRTLSKTAPLLKDLIADADADTDADADADAENADAYATDATDATNLHGFEFRMMDNMPSEAVEPLLNLFVLVAAATKARGQQQQKCERVQTSTPWSMLVADTLVHGRFAVPSAAFVEKLEGLLGVSSVRRGANAFDTLQDVTDKLRRAYGTHAWVKLMAPKMASSPKDDVRIVDSNFEAFVDAFQAHLEDNPDTQAKVRALIEGYCAVGDGRPKPTAKEIADNLHYRLGDGYRFDVPYIVRYIETKACDADAAQKASQKKIDKYFISTLKSRE